MAPKASKRSYMPILDLRPAEITALQEMPEKSKDDLCPMFKLRPWATSKLLENSTNRMVEAFGTRSSYLMLCEPEQIANRREVHDEIARLRDPRSGFNNWCDFFCATENEHHIPVLQLTEPAEFDAQAERLWSLGRGAGVVFEEAAMPFAEIIARRTAAMTEQGQNVLFVLDFSRETSAFHLKKNFIKKTGALILAAAPNAKLAISASSFPDGFVELESQEVYERLVFDELQQEFGSTLVYSDRASGRALKQLGGAGPPAPRIDLATATKWHFFREPAGDRAAAYQRQASKAIESPAWDGRLRIWGTQLIERTALGDTGAITSPPRAVAARINMHLHQQLYYGDSKGLYDTDEEWHE